MNAKDDRNSACSPSCNFKSGVEDNGVKTSRIPLPRSAFKRTLLLEQQQIRHHQTSTPTSRNHPVAQLGQHQYRLPSASSPNKFAKPDNSLFTPTEPIRNLRVSAINPSSPLATPPQRIQRNSPRRALNRLSVYGVPLSMSESTSSSSSLRKSDYSKSSSGTKRIVVGVRKRPLSTIEVCKGVKNCVDVLEDTSSLRVSVSRLKLDGLERYTEEFLFNFDHVYDEHAGNEQVYREIVHPLVEFVENGGRATCFAYGQTGSGKTHTMFHPHNGQCYLAMQELLTWTRTTGLKCSIGFFEIYQSHLFDLLRGRKRVVPCERRGGLVTIMGLEEDEVSNLEMAKEIINRGQQSRMTGKTGANAQSSRGHAVLQFTVRGSDGRIFGQLSFIDLAGSERGADRAEVDRQTKLEGSEINKSLLALKECIRAIDQDASHLPFRQSKLTLVLKDSIIGDVRTAMIATVSPASTSSEHSLNTMRYAERFFEISHGGGGSSGGNQGDGFQLDALPDKENHEKTGWQISPIVGHSATKVKALNIPLSPPKPDELVLLRGNIGGLLRNIQEGVTSCQDVDILELLFEELSTVSHAFSTLAANNNNNNGNADLGDGRK